MKNLSKTGRIFYGIAIAEFGLQAIYCRSFPYIVPLPEHFPKTASIILALIFGVIFTLAGACIVFEKKTRPVSILFGSLLVLIFCFYYIPYEFIISSKYMHFGDWENSAKELAIAGGAFVIAACYPKNNKNPFTIFPGKLIPIGAALYPITIISFSIDHFLYAQEAADYVPAWAPYRLFWMYFCGIALLGSGVAIILKIRTGLIATLLGAMIFAWFISLHLPRVIMSSADDLPGEITSAVLALAYSGTAFFIAATAKKAVE